MRANLHVSPPLDACLYGVHAVARGAGVARIALLVGLLYLINVKYTVHMFESSCAGSLRGLHLT